jgi:hypothetical protein
MMSFKTSYMPLLERVGALYGEYGGTLLRQDFHYEIDLYMT